ncbi:Cytochrome c556 [Paracoccus halophilus]|uniref:Cytochrome C n=1 Tax=Paracoccus halophilus TaxID=376733 RepID=A0A099F546_9RHOB|nr:cytochrome c [Paracoccus halophilus]KGJ05398.1 cytochrome C [Paracoccus halophilus]SFA49049.1 Cytochrome c556 [Paracoccus halophilus]
MRLILTAAALATIPLAAIAQDDPIRNTIEARQGFYKMLAINMGTLAGMAKGDIEYDETGASLAAANIEALAGYDLPSLFLEGSASGEVDGTAALPDIWEDMDDFRAKFDGLREAAAGASTAVTGGAGNVGPVVGKLGGACKACHDDYREKG